MVPGKVEAKEPWTGWHLELGRGRPMEKQMVTWMG